MNDPTPPAITDAELERLANTRPHPTRRAVLYEFPELVIEYQRRKTEAARQAQLKSDYTAALGMLSAERRVVIATAEPAARDDVPLVYLAGKARGLPIGTCEGAPVELLKGSAISFLPRPTFAALQGFDAGPLRELRLGGQLLVLDPEIADLWAALAASKPAPGGQSTGDMFAAVVESCSSRKLLEAWLAASDDKDRTEVLGARFRLVFGADGIWGGKDDRNRGYAEARAAAR